MAEYGLIRYPGSKAKLWRPVLEAMPDEITLGLWSSQATWEYREPFFGSGAIGFRVLDRISSQCRVLLSDKDYWLICLWQSVKQDPRHLCKKISEFKPSPEQFFKFKADDGRKDIDPLLAGFQKLALHQMSVSGFGVKSGTCLGGRNQENAQYPIDCRWNPVRLCSHVWKRHQQFKRFGRNLTIKTCDFSEALKGSHKKCFIYLDPPYVEKGSMLYKHAMTDDDHARLAESIKLSNSRWVISYDDHPLVRRLYSDSCIKEIVVRYSNATNAISRPKNKEIIIMPAFCHAS